MTLYADTRDAAGRIPLHVVELETTKRCSLTFASAPCTASGADGARCYYSRHTCQDTANFTASTYTWRFITAALPVPASIQTSYGSNTSAQYQLLPTIAEVSPVSQEIDLEAGFNRLGSVKVTLYNLGDSNDVRAMQLPGFDREKSTRNTSVTGTFWQRWLAQWPNYRNMTVRIKRGFLTPGFATTDLTTVWVGKLENVAVSQNGTVQLQCVDLLRPAEKSIPREVGSDSRLVSDVSRSATTLTVADASRFTDPAGLSSGYVHVQVPTSTGRTELMRVSALDTGADTLTVTRAQGGTYAEPCRADAEVHEVLYFGPDDGITSGRPMAIIKALLERVGLDAATYVDSTSFGLAEDVIGPVALRRVIDEPTECISLINEICELFQLLLYVGDSLKIEAVVNVGTTPTQTAGTVTDTTHVLAGSASVKTGDRQRLTHCRLYYDAGSGSDSWNAIAVAVNNTTFDADYYGSGEDDVQEKVIKSAWLRGDDDLTAGHVAVEWVKRFQHAPRRFKWSSDLRHESFEVGDWVDVTTDDLLDSHGATTVTRCLVVSKKPQKLYGYDYEAQTSGVAPLSQGGKRLAFVAPSGQADYGAASAAEKLYWYIGSTASGETTACSSDDGYYL